MKARRLSQVVEVFAGLLLAAQLAASAQETPQQDGNGRAPAAQSIVGQAALVVAPADPHPEEYRIGCEDVLSISVWENETLSRQVPVRPDGRISLPLLNDIRAAGLTPMQLRETIGRRLAEHVSSPEVSVMVVEVHSFKVSVLGQVARPGRYEVKGRATVLDMLALAGGFIEFAAQERVFVLRADGESVRRIPFDYKAIVLGRGTSENFPVQPDDIVIVPQ